MLDTKHFDQDFVDRLLASFDDLDEMTDGLLVHSENFQALNLLGEIPREVKCIYIDPPYNTQSDEFPLQERLPALNWLAMMANRIEARSFIVVYAKEHFFATLMITNTKLLHSFVE